MENKLLKCCRVCGLEYTNYYPWGEDGQSATYDICDCCGCEFGYDDDENASGKGVFVYRQEWFDKGIPLNTSNSKSLTIAQLKSQLSNIGVELTDEVIANIEKNQRKS
ncbi:MAG: hypothetical protein J6W29_05695 [Neisseriaceae bacterium]|nr:hypothetical protein [Neisseriaceae bacterium]